MILAISGLAIAARAADNGGNATWQYYAAAGSSYRISDDDDGAVGNRDAQYIGGFAATWPPGAPPDPHVAWARDGWERIRPFSTGGNYVNFQLAEDDAMRTADAYGRNYRRLQRVKATYDPDNLFRVNRNVAPAG